MSPTRQTSIRAAETAPRPLVGFAHDYPDGLASGMHTHPRAQLLYALSGIMRIEAPRAAYTVPPSFALFVPADVPHEIRMDGPVAMRTLLLRQDAARRTGLGIAVIAVSPLLREVILAACDEPAAWDRRGRGRWLAELALDEIARASVLPFALPMPGDARLRRAVDIVRARPAEDRRLSDLADAAGASSRTLARLFRAETGLSFRQWRQNARLAAAMEALARGAPPARAASIGGFSTQSSFGAAFRAVYGMTPGQARGIGRKALIPAGPAADPA